MFCSSSGVNLFAYINLAYYTIRSKQMQYVRIKHNVLASFGKIITFGYFVKIMEIQFVLLCFKFIGKKRTKKKKSVSLGIDICTFLY